jgi:hypothetical protein
MHERVSLGSKRLIVDVFVATAEYVWQAIEELSGRLLTYTSGFLGDTTEDIIPHCGGKSRHAIDSIGLVRIPGHEVVPALRKKPSPR